MKKMVLLLFAVLLLGCFAVPFAAAENDAPSLDVSMSGPMVDLPRTNQRLLDHANVLTDAEEAALLARLDKESEAYQFDIIIVTVPTIGEWDIEAFAGEYFVQNRFGYGSDEVGCVLVYDDYETGQWYVAAPDGESADAINEYCIDYLADHTEFQDDLRERKFSEAFEVYTDFVTDCVNEAQTQKPYGSRHRIDASKHKAIGAVISVVAGIIISAIVTLSVKSGYTSAVRKNSGAGDYLVRDSLKLREQHDRFMYTTVNKTPRADNDSGGRSGGSSGGAHYTSSSGRSFSGGGRKL